ncbi:MAG: TIGR03067 domain-containing protein [Gemmataceae bacterium]
MRCKAFTMLMVLFGAGVLAAAEPQGDMKKLTGFWKPVSVVYDGVEKFPEAKSRDAITLVVTEGEYRMYYCLNKAKDEHARLVTASLKLDEATKTLELNIIDGPRKGTKCHGLYEIKDGQIRICYGPVENPRPTKFAADAGSGIFLEIWKPEKQ